MTEAQTSESTASVDVQALEAQMDGGTDSTINVTSGGASFDDFDAMEMAREQYTSAKTREVVEKQKQIEEELGLTSEQKEQQVREAGDKNVDATLAPQPDRAEVKLIKGFDGDNPVDLNPDVVVPTSVDGETENVTLQELRDNYAGKIAYDKRFTELDKNKKSIEEKSRVADRKEKIFADIINLLKSENPADGLAYALDVAGVSSQSVLKNIVDKVYGDLEELADMTADERQVHFIKRENEFLRKRDETSLQRQQRLSRIKTKEVQLTQARQARNLSESEFVEGYNWIVDNTQLQPSQVTPDLIGDAALNLIASKQAASVLDSISPNLVNDDEVFKETFNFIREKAVGSNPAYTIEDVKTIVKETLGSNAEAAASKKVREPEQVETVRHSKEEEADTSAMFDDFESKYY